MGKIKRGGFVFRTWKGDHSPRHVHEYRDGDGKLVVKGDLTRSRAMKGKPSARLIDSIRELQAEGSAVKIRSVQANNRRKVFEVRVGRRVLTFPYAKAAPRPTSGDPILELYVDAELGREGFTYVLADGREGSVHVDDVLEYNSDPGYLRDLLLYRLTLEAQDHIGTCGLSRREISRRLRTSPTQLYRLLDQTNYRKSVDRVLELLHVLGCDVDLVVRGARGGPLSLRQSARSTARGSSRATRRAGSQVASSATASRTAATMA
ncbi:MAG: hypothetical protein ACREMQ_23580 [Longimicrobiales bacterium]